MLYRITDKTLQKIEDDPEFDGKFSHAIAEGFRKALQQIVDADDENVLRSIGSLHFEKLKGKRKHECSIRINRQFRLIFQIEPGESGNQLVITRIEKHYE